MFVARLFVRGVINAISNTECSIELVDDTEYLMELKNIEPIRRGLIRECSQHFHGGT